jgi:hypothetical protein
MKTMTWTSWLLLGAVAVGCGPGGPERAEISVADHADALTTKEGDNLFVLTLAKASQPYPLTDVSVNAGLPGQTATQVNFTHQDTNADGKLDQGETLTCKEPIVNLFDPTTVGKAVSVSFVDKASGTAFQVGSATWTPGN